jgi:predicted DNA-binding transcriptional regulator AlpA
MYGIYGFPMDPRMKTRNLRMQIRKVTQFMGDTNYSFYSKIKIKSFRRVVEVTFPCAASH